MTMRKRDCGLDAAVPPQYGMPRRAEHPLQDHIVRGGATCVKNEAD